MTISAEETNKAKEIIIRFKNAKYGSIKGYVKLNDFEILVNNETIDFLGLCAVTGMLSQECADYFINQIADTNAILLKSKTVVITPQFNAVSSRIELALARMNDNILKGAIEAINRLNKMMDDFEKNRSPQRIESETSGE